MSIWFDGLHLALPNVNVEWRPKNKWRNINLLKVLCEEAFAVEAKPLVFMVYWTALHSQNNEYDGQRDSFKRAEVLLNKLAEHRSNQRKKIGGSLGDRGTSIGFAKS